MKINVDLTNYPHLFDMYEKDQERFARMLRKTILHTEWALMYKRFDYAKDVYKMDYLDMLTAVMDTFFEPEGIAEQHYNKAEQQGLKGLGKDLHPLAIFTNNAPIYNARGENVSPNAWIQQDSFDIKNWLYALFYGARFVSWKELSEYLSLGQYDLVDVLKARNFEQLKHLQEQFEIQRQKGIPIGKLIAGTGKLDLGEGEANEGI